MKIVYLSNSLIPSQSANSVHVMKMANALYELGHEVILIGMKNSAQSEEEIKEIYGVNKNVTLKLIKSKKIRYIKNIFNGKESSILALENKPDLIIGRSQEAFYFLANSGIPYDFESHEPVFNPQYKLNGLFFKRLMLRKILSSKDIRGFVLISEKLKKLYDFRSFPDLKVIVAHDGADIVNFDEKQELQGISDKLKVGYIGKFHKGRGLNIVLNVAQKLSEIEFHLLGGSRDDLNNFYHDIQISNNIYFYNYINPADVYKYRNSFDILIAPYQNEENIGAGINTTNYMSPIKIFEYMASKKPIVASDFKVLREILNKKNAILVPPDNVDAWINAIKRLENDQLREKLANQAYLELKEKYTWKKRAERILKESGF